MECQPQHSAVATAPSCTSRSGLRYAYRSLKHREIRLLKIENPSVDGGIFRYQIEHVDLDAFSSYETVSYVWGDPRTSHEIHLVDGSMILVTESLGKALPCLSMACRTGHLWVDQITIDQSNIAERGDQVKIMGEIYSRSIRCLIWIHHDADLDAEHDVESDWNQGAGREVLELFRSLGNEQLDTYGQTGQSAVEETDSELENPAQAILRRRSSQVRNHLQWFFEHPWFTRTWVYQEFVLSPSPIFLIDGFELPGADIQRAFKFGWFQHAGWYNTFLHRLNISKRRSSVLHRSPGFEFLITAVQSRVLFTRLADRENGSQIVVPRHANEFTAYEVLTFSDMLEKMGGSKTQDDRDHVYGFIGMAPFLLKHMNVDYSLAVAETFAAMTKALIKVSGCIDFVGQQHFASDLSKSKLHLPSWVPNWTFYTPSVPILSHDNLFDACGKGFGLPSVDKCKHVDPPTSPWSELEVAGRIIDTVSFVLPPFSSYQVTPSLDIDFESTSGSLPWEASTLKMFVTEITQHGILMENNMSLKALLRTLLMDGVQWAALAALDSTKPLYRTGQHVIGQPHFTKTEALISALIDSDTPKYDDLPYGATLDLLHELSKVQYRRRVACCADGRYALMPDLVETGDVIAILHGSRCPVVLRTRLNRKYVILGNCYYDGAMYGEMADLNDDNADTFTLV